MIGLVTFVGLAEFLDEQFKKERLFWPKISVSRTGKMWWGRSVDFAKSTKQWLLHMADEWK